MNLNWRVILKSIGVAALGAAVQQLAADQTGQALLAAASTLAALWLKRPIDTKQE